MYLFFPSSLPLITELQETEPPWALATPSGQRLMVDFAVPGTSFPICCHFVTHMLTLFPSPSFAWENTMNKDLLVPKKQILFLFCDARIEKNNVRKSP